ncbi:MAG: sulfotransferase [Aliishimia sp.]
MTLPNFLLIGAMKAGTTTLYEDLTHVPGVYLPPEKEPNDLASSDVETDDGLQRYKAKFAAGAQNVARGDASTAYAKRPTYEGVAERALKLLGPDVKILFLTRDPIKRIVSQYHHLHGLGLETRGFNEAVLNDESYVAYSRYEWQLETWRAAFGAENVLVLRFEDYIADRLNNLQQVCAFIGVAPPEGVDDTHRNASEGKHVVKDGSAWARFAHSNFYLYRIKPLIPTSARDKIKAMLLPKTKKLDEALTQETLAELQRRLNPTQ